MEIYEMKLPLDEEFMKSLKAGDNIKLSGSIYTGRDAAHKKLVEMIKKEEELPFEFPGNIIFYAGPCPSKPGYPIGSIGPTTSGRMDKYTPLLIEHGLKYMIGKGERNQEVINALKRFEGIHFTAIGGAAAYMSKCVERVEMVAFEALGTEAIRKLYIKDFPLIVAIDTKGNNIYSLSK